MMMLGDSLPLSCLISICFFYEIDGLNVSDKSFKVLKFDNNRITLEEEL